MRVAIILSEGVVDPMPICDGLPDDLQPRGHFTVARIRGGLPEAKAFGLADCRWSSFKSGKA